MQTPNTTHYIAWNAIQLDQLPNNIQAAIQSSQSAISTIEKLTKDQVTFSNTFLALEEATQSLDKLWEMVSHLTAVADTPPLRAAYNASLPIVTDFFSRIPLNSDLYASLQAFATSPAASTLQPIEKRFIEETLNHFHDNGAHLSPKDQEQLASINAQLATLTQKYSENVLDSTNHWELILTNPAQLSGLPHSLQAIAKQNAESHGHNNAYRFTLHSPSYGPLLQYLDDDTIRKDVFIAASQIGLKAPYDNTTLIHQILDLRHQKAQLLNSPHFADLVLKRRMARHGHQALDFINDLHQKTLPFFKQSIHQLETYTQTLQPKPALPLEPWQYAYYSEKQRQELFHFDEECLRPYYALPSVIQGLFLLAEKLFSITIQENHNPHIQKWDPTVQIFDVFNQDQTHIGAFYTDWFPRANKRCGAWMGHFLTDNPQFKLGCICGNLTPPTHNIPALLTHREVETIFHEFGHLLHHLLGTVPIRSLDGIHVAWDFVELPSQIMENWCWERSSLDLFAHHYQTQETIPQDLFAKLSATRTYQSALHMMRQLAFAKLDLELHTQRFDPSTDLETYTQTLLQPYLPPYKTPTLSILRRFTHIFGSPTGYAAGYYSYKWAEVLDADAFTRFQKEGILNASTGKDFKDTILSQGNSQPPEKLFRDFMHRDPSPTALLTRSGLTPN